MMSMAQLYLVCGVSVAHCGTAAFSITVLSYCVVLNSIQPRVTLHEGESRAFPEEPAWRGLADGRWLEGWRAARHEATSMNNCFRSVQTHRSKMPVK